MVHLDEPLKGPDGQPCSTLHPLLSTPFCPLSDLGDVEPYRDVLASMDIDADARIRVVALGTRPLLQGGGLLLSGYIEMEAGLIVLADGVTLERGDRWARPDLNWGLKLPKLRA